MTSTSASTPVYQRVSRARIESSMIALRFALDSGFALRFVSLQIVRRGQHVAFAAPRVNERHREAVIYLSPQPVDVDINEIRERVEVFVPHVLGNFGATEHAPPLMREVFEQ